MRAAAVEVRVEDEPVQPARLSVERAPSSESPPARVTRSPRRVLLLCFVMAVVGFIAASVATAGRLREVSIQSEDIYANAMPSVIALSALRERMHDLAVELSTALDSRATIIPGFDQTVTRIELQSG